MQRQIAKLRQLKWLPSERCTRERERESGRFKKRNEGKRGNITEGRKVRVMRMKRARGVRKWRIMVSENNHRGFKVSSLQSGLFILHYGMLIYASGGRFRRFVKCVKYLEQIIC